jgi:tetratricopeptide (TPR) repeat protein
VYELYLKARYENWQFNEVSFNKAEKLLNQGLKVAGDNELLYTELCHVYVQYVNNLLMDPESYPELLAKADDYAKKALSLNPVSALAHYAQGMALYQGCHPKEALESWEKAIAIEPNHSESMLYFILGFMYSATGLDLDKAEKLMEKAQIIDPVTPIVKTCQGWRLLFTGEFQKMVDEFEEWKQVMEQIKSPTSIWFAWWHGLNKDFKESFRIIDWVVSNHPKHIMASLGQFMKYSWMKEKKKALVSVSDTLEKAAWWDDAYSLMMAEGYTVIGEYDKAFKFLNRAIDYGFTNIDFLAKYDHFLENLRSDQRFELCLKKAKGILDDLRSVSTR